MSEGLPSPLLFGIFLGITIGDVNRDNLPDIAVANTIQGPEVYLQRANGSWAGTPDVMPPMLGGAASVALGDLDGDGVLDLVVGGKLQKSATSQYGVYALKGDAQGHFAPLPTNLPSGGLEVTWGLATADINRDARTDVVVTVGGSMGSGRAGETEPASEKSGLPHVQVWLNQPR
jgi:hypothetical protein